MQSRLQTGGFGNFAMQPVKLADVISVLGDECQFDPNGMNADHYTRCLSANDFFSTLTPQMERQILRLIVRSKGVGFMQVRGQLYFAISEVLGEQ